MPSLAERVVSDLRLLEGSEVLVFGDAGVGDLTRIAEAAGGFERLTILYRGLVTPVWAKALGERGAKVLRSHLYEHNDFLAVSSFDAILASNVLDGLLGKREFLGEAYRLLKPGGRLVIVQRLWPASRLKRKAFLRLIEGARSYRRVVEEVRILGAYVVLERPSNG
jgi:SAM-dependent methyltransferase